MSLFPEIDEELKQIKIKENQSLQRLIRNSQRYRPSNSSEGDWFYRNFCDKCSKDNESKNILCETMGLLLGADSEDVRKYHDVLQYDYELPDEIVDKYELVYLGIKDERSE